MTNVSGEKSPNCPSSNVRPELLVLSHNELLPLEADVADQSEKLKAAKNRLKLRRKIMEKDGIDLDAFDAARAEFLADANDVREKYRKKASMLRAFNSPLAHQFDLFDQPDMDSLKELWRFEGFKAGINGEDVGTNPHGRGSEGFDIWEAGWKGGQATLVAGMKMREEEAAANEPEEEDEPEEDEQTDIEDAVEAAAEEAEAEDDDESNVVPFDEDSALRGIEG